jgi:hypothetical protein
MRFVRIVTYVRDVGLAEAPDPVVLERITRGSEVAKVRLVIETGGGHVVLVGAGDGQS